MAFFYVDENDNNCNALKTQTPQMCVTANILAFLILENICVIFFFIRCVCVCLRCASHSIDCVNRVIFDSIHFWSEKPYEK